MLFKILTRFTAALMGLSLAACLPAETGTQGDGSATATSGVQSATRAATSNPVVTDRFPGGSTRWNDGSTLIYRFTAIERDGEIFVCGAYTGAGSSYNTQFNRELLRRSQVTANGETVFRNLTYFYKASEEMLDTQLVGSETRCQSTSLAAGSVPLEAVKVELRQGRFRIRV